jgi:hypothetical protein
MDCKGHDMPEINRKIREVNTKTKRGVSLPRMNEAMVMAKKIHANK